MPVQTEYDDTKAKLHRYLISKTDFIKVKDTLNDDQMRLYVDAAITALSRENDIMITLEDRLKLIREIASSVMSLGPIRPLLEDKEVTEVMINGYRQVYAQRSGKMFLTGITFDDNAHLMHTIQKLMAASGTSRRVDESSPYVDFSLNDGSRVNVLLPPCSMVGPVVTVRKFSRDISTVDNLVDLGTLSRAMATFLIAAVKAKLNIVFCGATGSGKTTVLNVLSRHISEDERIITIEDTSELRLLQQHVVGLQSKSVNIEGKGAVSIRDLFINSLRMRPDRIIIGEVRGEEILDMIQSISSGHSGTMAIVHADSPEECFNRMITMMLMSGIRLSGEQVRRQIATSIELIVYTELFMDGVRRIVNITDLRFDKETDRVSLEDIFKFKQEHIDPNGKVQGHWVMNKKLPSFADKFAKRNVRLPQEFMQ
ncbi:MAG: CpaF family protein [Candidatus Omnitrophica bacterium]|nr:CpaF family protein [Candidatus Omnitrophota bacterium]